MRTNTMAIRSSNDRGRSAERIPTAEARSLEVRCKVGGVETAYRHQTTEELAVLDVQRSVGAEVVRRALDALSSRALAAGEAGRVGRDRVEDDVGDDRHGDEQHHRPQHPADQVAEHGSGL